MKRSFLSSLMFLCMPACMVCHEIPELSANADVALSILRSLSLEQKIGQLFMVPAVSGEVQNVAFMLKSPYSMNQAYVEKMITEYHAGGVIFLGRGEAEKQVERTRRYQELSAVPLLVGMDFEWGLGMRLDDGISFPRAMTQAAMRDESLIYAIGKEIAQQAQSLGVHIVFAPVVDVNNNPHNPVIHTRSFGDNPDDVARKALLMMRGLHDGGVLSCAKHFIGHGDTNVDSHEDLPTISHNRSRLDAIELYPFKKMIKEGAPAIMVAHLSVPALEKSGCPSSLSVPIVTDLLQKELGFKGLIITDGLGMVGVTKNYGPGEPELLALLAGNDILLCPVHMPMAVALIKKALKEGRFSEAELNRRVLKILCAKIDALQKNPTAFNPEYDSIRVHTAHAQALKKEAYSSAVTVVRDTENLLTNHDDTYELISVSARTLADAQAQKETVRERIAASLARGRKPIIALFGTPYALPLFDTVGTVIVAYEDVPDTRDAVEKIIRGEMKATGVLPVALS